MGANLGEGLLSVKFGVVSMLANRPTPGDHAEVRKRAGGGEVAVLIPALGACASRMTSGERRLAERLEEKLDDDYLLW